MSRWLKIALKILGGLVAFAILLSVAGAIYVSANKQKIIKQLTAKANEQLHGSLTIGDLSPSFLNGFPGISISLKNVVLRDSLWQQHHHDLLNAEKILVTVNAFALFKGDVHVSRIGLSNSRVFLYTDSTGYSNTAVFGTKKKTGAKSAHETPSIEIGRVNMDKVEFTLDNQYRRKLFHFSVDDFRANMDYPSSGWQADIKLKTFVHDLGFNTRRGSFIKNKLLNGSFKINYDEKAQTVTFDPKKVDIGESTFFIGARFDLKKEPLAFRISIETRDIRWKDATDLLAPNISRKMKMFDIEQPIPVQTSIIGDFGTGDPVIRVNTEVSGNTLVTPGGTVTDASFKGLFTNADVPAKGTTNANSAIKIFDLKGNYEGIPFRADTTVIENFDSTVAHGVFKANFPLTKLNEAINYNGLAFNAGEAQLNLRYSADIVNYRFSKPQIQGDIIVNKADFNYLPRNIRFQNTSFAMLFRGPDLLLKNTQVQSGKSIIKMTGRVNNFLNFYYNAPEKIVVNWDIYSPQIYLTEFLGYLKNRRSGLAPKTPRKTDRKRSTNLAANRIDELLKKSQANMRLRVDQLHYDKFLATNAQAIINMSEAGVKLQKLRVNHAGGLLNMTGYIDQHGMNNQFSIQAQVSNVNISKFFYAFNNFGIDGLSYQNLRGDFFSKINVAGALTDAGKLVSRSMKGVVTFDLKNGALVNYPPFVSISKFALRGRGLENVTFSNLNGQFDIDREKIIITPMKINSSAINMDVAGVYSLGKGTNIMIDVPLRNPKKDAEITDDEKRKEKRMKGLVLHLVAKDGDDGKIHFGIN